MSHEGHVQHWCQHGHYWESVEWPDAGGYPVPREQTHVCHTCGGPSWAYNWVDDTNLDLYGECPIKDRIPTVDELWQHAHQWKTSFWHHDLPEYQGFLDAVNAKPNRWDQTLLWKWATDEP